MFNRIKSHFKYKKTHKRLVEAMQNAAMQDERIKFDADVFERDWLEKLRSEDDPELAGLADMIEKQIELREKGEV